MIAVLSPACSDERVADLRHRLAERGWTSEASRGREQVVLVVAGPENEGQLAEALGPDVEADVIALRGRKEYAKQRRRRSRTHVLVGGLGILLAFGLGIPVLFFLHAPEDVFAMSDVVPVAKLDRLAEHSARIVRVDGKPILLVRADGERLFAVSAVCTHMDDCQLEWSAARRQIVCPCHGGVYDVYGNVVEGPPSVPLRSYAVDVLGNEVRILRRS